MKEFHKLYGPYYPACLTALGGLIVALSFFLGGTKDTRREQIINAFRLGGAVIASIGAFWSGAKQVKSAAENRARNEKLLLLSEKIRGEVTGGDGFCYAWAGDLQHPEAAWIFHNKGEFPLYDVNVRIWDVELGQEIYRLSLGNIPAGFATPLSLQNRQRIGAAARAYNLWFTARNGAWMQELRVIEPPHYSCATRVTRNFQYTSPLHIEVPPHYPGATPQDAPWNQSPADMEAAALAAGGSSQTRHA